MQGKTQLKCLYKKLYITKCKRENVAISQHTDLYLKREPMRINPERAELFWTGPLRRKKAWCSTAHFHKCLQAFGWSIRNTNVCSCSFPYGRGQRAINTKFTIWCEHIIYHVKRLSGQVNYACTGVRSTGIHKLPLVYIPYLHFRIY